MKSNEILFYGVTTKGILHTFIESYSNFPITFFNIFKAPFTSALIKVPFDILNILICEIGVFCGKGSIYVLHRYIVLQEVVYLYYTLLAVLYVRYPSQLVICHLGD